MIIPLKRPVMIPLMYLSVCELGEFVTSPLSRKKVTVSPTLALLTLAAESELSSNFASKVFPYTGLTIKALPTFTVGLIAAYWV